MAKNENKLSRFFSELKRRKIVRVIIVYATTAFVLLQLVSILVDPLHLPVWVMPLLIVILAVGFPIAIILAWAFHMKPEEGPERIEKSEGGKDLQLTPVKREPPEKSILVLPFDNISSDPEQEYFSDGLTEEIITDLSYIKDLLVISRSSAMTFKGTKQTIKEIADKVSVKYVLEGSVRKSINKIRITAQLIDAQNDVHLWAKKYDGEVDDIFDIQEKVSGSIAHELKVKLNSNSSNSQNITDIRIFNAYYKALSAVFRFGEQDTLKAIKEIDDTIEEIGSNALLYTVKAWAMWSLVNLGYKPFDYLHEANIISQKALQLDPDLARTHAVLGWINLMDDFRKATEQFKKALFLDPKDQFALQGIIVIYSCVGKINESIYYMNRLQKIDPLNYLTLWLRGGIPFYKGDFKKATSEWLDLYENHIADASASFYAAISMLYFESYEKVSEFVIKVINETSRHNYDKLLRMLRWVIENNFNNFNAEFDDDLKISCDHDWTMMHHIAQFYSMFNLKSEALKWLAKAIDKGLINYPLIAGKDILLNNIRGEKKFSELVAKAKYEWENFEV